MLDRGDLRSGSTDARPCYELKIVRYGRNRKIIAVVLTVLAVLVVFNSVLRNPNMEWGTVWRYFTAREVLAGLWLTLWMTIVVFVGAFLLGVPIALMRMSRVPVVSGIAWTYVWVFRSTPLLVQLLFWYNIAAVYPEISVGIPFGKEISQFMQSIGLPAFQWEIFSAPSKTLLSPVAAGIMALVLHEAAPAAEIIRGGISAVDPGQTEAAQSLGIPRWTVQRRVILPQAMRSIVPAAGNQLISILKSTTLVSVVAISDLLYSVQLIYNRTYEIVPLLIVATAWYLIACAVLSSGQYYVERYFARGAMRQMPLTPIQRFRSAVRLRESKADSTNSIRIRNGSVE